LGDQASSNPDGTTRFATLLRRYRLVAGLTQEALAERVGLGARSIQDLERGIHQPRRATARKLAGVLLLDDRQRRAFEDAARPTPRGWRAAGEASPRPATSRAVRANLPTPLTSFVGRSRELAEVKERLRTTRLLTLTGAGGCGKTRLALRLAADLVDDYPDGVACVELATIGDPGLVDAALARALSVREQPPAPILTTLAKHLKARQLLLVVDNCEHLVGACASLADALLRSCPRLRMLATSREALGIDGELTWRVPSLTTPPPLAPDAEMGRRGDAGKSPSPSPHPRVTASGGVGPGEVLDLLTRLVDQSLVQVDQPGDVARYRLLESLRQYAADRLAESGEREAVARRHADYYLDLAEAARSELLGFGGARRAEWLARLDQERDNLRAALHWAVASGEAELAARLGGALWRYWVHRGQVGEGWRWLERLLASPPSVIDEKVWAEVLVGAGVLARFRGDVVAARSYGDEGIRRLRELNDRPCLAEALVDLGVAVRLQGAYEEAQACFEEGLAIWRACEAPTGVLHALTQLALLADQQRDVARAGALGQELWELARVQQNRQGEGFGASVLGWVALLRGNPNAAEAWFRRSLADCLATGYEWGVSVAILRFGYAAAAQSQAERALRLVGAVSAMHETMGVAMAPVRLVEMERWLAPCREALGDAVASAAWAEGHAMTREEAIDYALSGAR
jgi:predicted ATPase/DNA-binding XRE family transcriptional regulator